jgi:hypothetical protein
MSNHFDSHDGHTNSENSPEHTHKAVHHNVPEAETHTTDMPGLDEGHIVNKKNTNKGDPVTYIDYEGKTYDAVIKDINIRHGCHYADLEAMINGKSTLVDAPYNASPVNHSWNHAVQPTPTAQKPSIGRIVHYVLDSGQSKGQHRPAMIVRVWSDTCVQLTVFTDWSNDFGPDQHGGGGILWRPSVTLDETGEKPGTYHWPERV